MLPFSRNIFIRKHITFSFCRNIRRAWCICLQLLILCDKFDTDSIRKQSVLPKLAKNDTGILNAPKGCYELQLVTQSCLTLCNPMDCIACQAALSMELSRQEYWSVYLFPSPGDLPDPGIEPRDWIQGLLYCRQILYCLRHQGSPYHMNYSSPFYIHHSLVNLCFWQVGGMTVHQRIYKLICYHFSMVCNPTFYLFFFFSSTSLLLPTHHPPPSCTHAQSCNPMDCSLPGSSVHGLFQARILEWVAISFSMNVEF